MSATTQTYTLLKEHEDNGVLKPAGAPVQLTQEQWHLLHAHQVVGKDPERAAATVVTA